MPYSLNLLKTGAILLALFLSLPLLSIFTELLYVIFQNLNTQDSNEILTIKENLNHFFSYLFIKFLKDTFLVLLGVLSLSFIIGVSSAYLVANFEFYFSNILEKLLILPLAIPAYILAFIYVGIMDYQGVFYELFHFRINFF